MVQFVGFLLVSIIIEVMRLLFLKERGAPSLTWVTIAISLPFAVIVVVYSHFLLSLPERTPIFFNVDNTPDVYRNLLTTISLDSYPTLYEVMSLIAATALTAGSCVLAILALCKDRYEQNNSGRWVEASVYLAACLGIVVVNEIGDTETKIYEYTYDSESFLLESDLLGNLFAKCENGVLITDATHVRGYADNGVKFDALCRRSDDSIKEISAQFAWSIFSNEPEFAFFYDEGAYSIESGMSKSERILIRPNGDNLTVRLYLSDKFAPPELSIEEHKLKVKGILYFLNGELDGDKVQLYNQFKSQNEWDAIEVK